MCPKTKYTLPIPSDRNDILKQQEKKGWDKYDTNSMNGLGARVKFLWPPYIVNLIFSKGEKDLWTNAKMVGSWRKQRLYVQNSIVWGFYAEDGCVMGNIRLQWSLREMHE